MFDQTMANQQFGGMQGGYQFNGVPAQVTKINSSLTPEEIKELQQSSSQFSLGLTQKDILRAACNHRTADGLHDSLTIDQNTGIARCTICGYEFRPIEPNESIESIKDSTNKIVDILQTIKIMYRELPAAAFREYFQIIPLIEKIPQLFEFAAKDFAKHEYNAWSYNNYNMGGAAMFQNLSNMFAPNMNASQGGYMGQPQQTPMGFGYQQGFAPQQPMGYPQQMGQPAPIGNAFGYPGASMGQPQQPQGYTPSTPQGFQYTPNQTPNVTPSVSAPAAPTSTADTTAKPATDTVTQKVSV